MKTALPRRGSDYIAAPTIILNRCPGQLVLDTLAVGAVGDSLTYSQHSNLHLNFLDLLC